MRVTSKGQVTIPIEVRRQLDIDTSTELAFEVVGNVVHIHKVGGNEPRGARILARLLATPYQGPSTAELMALTRGDD
jgi:AbrB family looped-hinge helix DNA binding protein